jgi:fatty acid desaturase
MSTRSAKTLERHAALTKDFQQLHKELEDEGFFQPSPLHIFLRFLEIFAFIYFLLRLKNSGYSFLALLVAGFMAGRSGFLVHEAGHYSLTGNPRIDRFLESFVFGKLSTLLKFHYKTPNEYSLL